MLWWAMPTLLKNLVLLGFAIGKPNLQLLITKKLYQLLQDLRKIWSKTL